MVYLVYQFVGALLWLIAVYWGLKRVDLKRVFGIDLAFLILVSGLVGGRFFHVFYEDLSFYQQEPLAALKLWQGGFVFYGGLFFALLSAFIFCRLKQQSFLAWADFFAPYLAAGYIYGRLGCFIAGCCFGSYCDLPWAIAEKHPTQLYAMMTEFLVLLFLLSEKKQARPRGVIFGWWLVGHGIGRIFMEHYRADFRGEFILGLSISFWVSLLIILAGSGLLILKSGPNKSRA